jgi:hypothetical protein
MFHKNTSRFVYGRKVAWPRFARARPCDRIRPPGPSETRWREKTRTGKRSGPRPLNDLLLASRDNDE